VIHGSSRFFGQHGLGLRALRLPLAFGSQPQQVQLFGVQFTRLARFEIEHQRPVPHAPNLLDMVSDLLEHLA
jgi:hypothetical protein